MTPVPESGAAAEAEAGAGACAACGEELVPGARFCEACGAATGADPAGDPTEDMPAAARPGAEVCEHCGGAVGDDGYCTSCGLRAREPVAVDDRGALAYGTHRGRRHPRNEDAAALAATAEGWPVLVVADGVSASPNPHLAAAAAVAAAAGRLDGRAFAGDDDLLAAVAAADEAARGVPAAGDPQWPEDGTSPACTLVVAVATPTAVHVANVGDARAYALAPTGAGAWEARQASTDDGMAAQAVAAGADPAEALAGPAGHSITAWLGADGPALAPHLARAEGAALVLACSDGLWNYAPSEDEMGALIADTLAGPPGPLGPACEHLVSWAVDQGGVDNICVALALPPIPSEETA